MFDIIGLQWNTVFTYSYNRSGKVAVPPLVSKRLLDQVRERIRYLHYSLKTEKAYLYWVRFFVLWAACQGGMRHPKEMGAADVAAGRAGV